eukprot:TRINITY_DN6104_c0_g2_i1.p1 TRINITY_DN6104_c0_g2~~TRINITY_DN6104_c0_g2_i1.p1  ORF type:complete len:270 (+),score=33.24 TRINITY_DN6104_c0_g2_i1:41-850(+)
MFRLISFYVVVKSVSAARTSGESETNASTPFTTCSSLEVKFTRSMQNIDSSIERGNDLHATPNIFRMLVAARSVKAARKDECEWLSEQAGGAHRDDYPSFKKYMLAELAKRPCHEQIIASLEARDLKGFVASYRAEQGSCKNTRADISEAADAYPSIVDAVGAEVDHELEKLDAQATSADSLTGAQRNLQSLIQLSSTQSSAIPRPGERYAVPEERLERLKSVTGRNDSRSRMEEKASFSEAMGSLCAVMFFFTFVGFVGSLLAPFAEG